MSGSRRRAGQHGMTLIEVLLALVVSATILVPLTAWAVFGFGEEVRTIDRVADANQNNLLATYLTRDVHSAASVTTGGDCTSSSPPEAASRVLLNIAADDPATVRIVYTVAPSSDDATRASIWRRTCSTAPDAGEPAAASELVKDLDPLAVTATCGTTPTDTACGEVTITYPSRSGAPVHHSATRRSGSRWPS